ncbi:hypothetical protein QO058_26185 [Bosea vestrisii]|uniref:hypothetical protein n=1 Tax=Bosea vestrisii TaxID=151416 RepID=UPI0024DFE40A|nr:hypothetical protein [Bosea vestrisii]WID96181.1 hypothetical protein QO058_26185 [Bosea vestrisii]
MRLQRSELGADAAALRRWRLAEEQKAAAAVAAHGAILVGELRQLAGNALRRLGGACIAAALALQVGIFGAPVVTSRRLRQGCARERGKSQRRSERASERSENHRRQSCYPCDSSHASGDRLHRQSTC